MRRFLYIFATLVFVTCIYAAWALTRPLPALTPVSTLHSATLSNQVSLPWPPYGEAAVGAVGYGTLVVHGTQKPLPTASVAKMVTALAVLNKKPLASGSNGPTITLGPSDVALYQHYVSEDGSVVAVSSGEQINEYQALEAMLLPSANNMADSLAAWAFGSQTAYVAFANDFVNTMGLKDTHIADASGFSPNTTSTAADLVKLGLAAVNNPAIKQIVGEKQADLPVAGTVNNVNWLLGQDGFNGIKTGNTDQAGGVFLGSGTYTVDGIHKITLVTVVMGAPRLQTAMDNSVPLMDAAQKGFSSVTTVKAGDIVGYYNTPWHTSDNAVATSTLSSFGWTADPPQANLILNAAHVPAKAGTPVGSVRIDGSSSKVTLQYAIDEPSWTWRLLHP